jgi:hypothetical protein
MAPQELEQFQGRPMIGVTRTRSFASAGFAVRKRFRSSGGQAWWQTVTDYAPEPWPAAQARERAALPFKPGRLPAASR